MMPLTSSFICRAGGDARGDAVAELSWISSRLPMNAP
jgi:hypothetical protein